MDGVEKRANDFIQMKVEDLEKRIRSKDDLYYILRQCCKSHLHNSFRPILLALKAALLY